MYEHYDEYDDGILRQDQHFECPHCLRTFARTVWYREFDAQWLPDEEDE
jgi:transposase-like protein